MTTAHKPTFHPAVGSANQGGYRYHVARQQFDVKEMASHTKLKFRQTGQGTIDEVKSQDLKADLLLRERKHYESKGLLPPSDQALLEYSKDGDTSEQYIEMDISQFDDSDDSIDESSGSDEDSEDEDADLLRELEKIKQEKEEERQRRELEEEHSKSREQSRRFLENPLLSRSPSVASSTASEFVIKRRWDDDVVFRNQARNEPEPKRRYLNDTIRNDFHVKFMKKYIK